jgi:hypothetical protein
LKAAVEGKVLRSRRLRVDCTAMEADVRYPTDAPYVRTRSSAWRGR